MRAPPSAAVRPGWVQRWWLDQPVRAKPFDIRQLLAMTGRYLP
jgi:hypothetical protein